MTNHNMFCQNIKALNTYNLNDAVYMLQRMYFTNFQTLLIISTLNLTRAFVLIRISHISAYK